MKWNLLAVIVLVALFARVAIAYVRSGRPRRG
jgi:hypothetical protein